MTVRSVWGRNGFMIRTVPLYPAKPRAAYGCNRRNEKPRITRMNTDVRSHPIFVIHAYLQCKRSKFTQPEKNSSAPIHNSHCAITLWQPHERLASRDASEVFTSGKQEGRTTGNELAETPHG